MKKELESPQPLIDNIVFRDSCMLGLQAAQFNNFVRVTLSTYIKSRYMVTLINQKFTEEIASKKYEREVMLN